MTDLSQVDLWQEYLSVGLNPEDVDEWNKFWREPGQTMSIGPLATRLNYNVGKKQRILNRTAVEYFYRHRASVSVCTVL